MKLKIDALSMSYGEINVLDDISIDLDGYTSIAMIGASGCGKSTLLRLLSGIEFPQKGSLTINEYKLDRDNLQDYQSNIGFVFQDHNLFPHLSIKKNITLILNKCKGFSSADADKKADELLQMLHLKDQAGKLPRHVSGGQSQRASIARALSTDPELLLLDEPTASLDPILTHEVLKAIQELKCLGKDFIFVTHELGFVKSFADYVLFIDQHKIVEHGTTSILENPTSEELKTFMKNVSY